jgi:L-alanine-DL-glutamate epimerase-like enolase superfamily enzyme
MSAAADSTIAALVVAPFRVALRAPFGIATGAQHAADNVLVTLRLGNGTLGIGEAAPFPAVNGETQDHAVAACEAAREVLLGEDVRRWRHLAKRIKDRVEGAPSARCALETAILDALCRHRGISLLDFFGGAERELVTDLTITTGSLKETEGQARDGVAQGIRTFKIKIGSGDPTLDVERVARVHKVAPRARLLLDGNCGYDARGSIKLLAEFARRGIPIALFEQPVAKDDLEGMRAVAEAGDVPIAADESVQDAASALAVIRRGAAEVLNVKIMKCGIVEALDVIALARASRTKLMIGGMVETRIAMSTSACLAAGSGGFDFVDLDTPMFLVDEPFEGGYRQREDVLHLADIAAGHGVAPRSPTSPTGAPADRSGG